MVACHACMDELKWHIDGHEKQILKGNQKKLPSLCLHTLPPHPTCPKIWYAPHDFRPKEKRHHCLPHLYLLRGFLWVPLTPFSFLFFTPCLFPLSLSHTHTPSFFLFIFFALVQLLIMKNDVQITPEISIDTQKEIEIKEI